MSDRQLGRAAVEHRRLIFHPADHESIPGYLVGMDDFHWLVATPASDVDKHHLTVLIHKSCPLVAFSHVFLDEESEDVQLWVKQVGKGFWEHCKTTYLGHRTATTEQEQK